MYTSRKFHTLIFITFFVFYAGDAFATDVGGTIGSNTTWDSAGSPYVVTSDILVSSGVTLTIDSNVAVKFQSGTKLQISGTLTADAAGPTTQIYFTSYKDDTVGGDSNGDGSASTPAAGDWMGLWFNADSSGNGLNYVVVRYGDEGSYGAIYTATSGLSLTNSTISDSRVSGLYVTSGATPTVDANTFENNQAYGVYLNASAPTINGNTITGNTSGGIYVTGETANLTNNLIDANAGPGIELINRGTYTTVSGNTLTNNTHNGIEVSGTLSVSGSWASTNAPYVAGNIIVNSGATLTIDPNVAVKFQAGSQLQVSGTLVADAASGTEIYFTSMKDDTVGGDTNADGSASTPAAGDWKGLWFNAGSTGNILDYIDVRYGDDGSYGAIYTAATGLSLTNSKISYANVSGLYVTNASPTVTQNSISETLYGIYITDGGGTASPIITNNEIFDTPGGAAQDKGIYLSFSSGILSPVIYHNTIDGNTSYGIYLVGAGAPDIQFNNITNSGTGIYNSGGTPLINWNNVILNTLDFSGCTAGANGIGSDPLYKGITDYNLQAISPSIDKIPPATNAIVIDKAGVSRPQPTLGNKDIGCYEYAEDSDSDGMLDSLEMVYFGDLSHVGTEDTDLDDLSDLDECLNGTSPINEDTDNDGYYDGEEVAMSSDPIDPGTTPAYAPGTYYVDISNAVLGDGSSANPWQYPQHALHHINDGNLGDYTVNIAAGTYSSAQGVPDEQLIVNQDNVTLIGSGAGAIFDALGGMSNWDNGIIVDANNCVIRNITVANFRGDAFKGIELLSGTNHQILGCEIVGCDYGIFIAGDSGSNIIANGNIIYHNLDCGIYINGSSANQIRENDNSIFDNGDPGPPVVYGTGIMIDAGAADNLIHNNQIYWSGDTNYPQKNGVYIQNGGSGNEISENLIWGHYAITGCCGIEINDSSPDILRNDIHDNDIGIKVDAISLGISTPLIQNNLIHDTANHQNYGVYIGQNYGTTTVQLLHNTIDSGNQSGIQIVDGAAATAYYNCITHFTYAIDAAAGSCTVDYNNLWGNSNTPNDYNNCGPGANDVLGDPLYASDLSIPADSPCVDAIPPAAGDTVDTDVMNTSRPRDGDVDGTSAHDIGAYEYPYAVYNGFSLPGGTGLVTDYRIMGIPLEIGTGADLKIELENQLGTYDPVQWRVFALIAGTTSYTEMGDSAFDAMTFYAGSAFWIISQGNSALSFEGDNFGDNGVKKLPLMSGWNLFALPWLSATIELGNLAITDGTNSYWITSAENTFSDAVIWDYTGSGPYSGYEKLQNSTDVLQTGTGYWIKAYTDGGLLIPPDNAGGHIIAKSAGLDATVKGATRDVEEPPAPPGIDGQSDGSTDAAASQGVAEGGGGCFIEALWD